MPIGKRLQNVAMRADATNTSTMSHGIPPAQVPPSYTVSPNTDGNQIYPISGSTPSIPTSAPGMYNYTPNLEKKIFNWSTVHNNQCFTETTHDTAQ